MLKLNLNGEWAVSGADNVPEISAHVPGNIYADLLAAEAIPDPFYRDNENKLQWIGRTNWHYRRSFSVDDELLNHKQVFLQCEGLDLFATVFINDTIVAETDNMFRRYEWDVKNYLILGEKHN